MKTLGYAMLGLGLFYLWRGNVADRAARRAGESGTRAVPLLSPAGAALTAAGAVLLAASVPWAPVAGLGAWLLADATNERENARLLVSPGEWFDAEGNVVP